MKNEKKLVFFPNFYVKYIKLWIMIFEYTKYYNIYNFFLPIDWKKIDEKNNLQQWDK